MSFFLQVEYENYSDFQMSHRMLTPFEDDGDYCHRNLKQPDEMEKLKSSMLVRKE